MKEEWRKAGRVEGMGEEWRKLWRVEGTQEGNMGGERSGGSRE